jgi:heme-degrading monooxygenase HmoA
MLAAGGFAHMVQAEDVVVMRRWRSRIRTGDRTAYAAYINATGGADYAATPGNLGFQMLMRDLGDGSTEVTTLSWWRSTAAIEAFAGHDISRARYYPEDDRFLLEKPEAVDHYEVVAGDLVGSSGGR